MTAARSGPRRARSAARSGSALRRRRRRWPTSAGSRHGVDGRQGVERVARSIRPATSQPPPANARSRSAAALVGRRDTQDPARRAGWRTARRAQSCQPCGPDQQAGLHGLDPQHQVLEQRLELDAARRDPGREQPEATLAAARPGTTAVDAVP